MKNIGFKWNQLICCSSSSIYLSLSLFLGLAVFAGPNSSWAQKGGGGGGKVTICHFPPTNPNNYQTISINPRDVQDHVSHGDCLGSCTQGCWGRGGSCPNPDGKQCTDDVCPALKPGVYAGSDAPKCGDCSFTNKAEGSACGNSTSTSCDAADTCDGFGTCIDNVDSEGTVCKTAGTNATCDPADTCNGTTKDCPANVAASGTACGGSDAACDALDTCNSSGGCVDNLDAAGTECQAANGICDPADTCDGTTKYCTANFAAAGISCRESLGSCDVAESCTGTSGACPVDTKETTCAVQIENQAFSINENSPNGTPVGTVLATSAMGSISGFSILESDSPFTIDSTGKLIVSNFRLLDYEQNPSFSINVTASNGVLSNTALIQVSLNDVSPTTVTFPDKLNGNLVSHSYKYNIDVGIIDAFNKLGYPFSIQPLFSTTCEPCDFQSHNGNTHFLNIPVDEEFTFVLEPYANDPDDFFELISILEPFNLINPPLPPGAIIDASGVFKWTPQASDIGKEYWFDTRIRDSDTSGVFGGTVRRVKNSAAIRLSTYKPAQIVSGKALIVTTDSATIATSLTIDTSNLLIPNSFTFDGTLTLGYDLVIVTDSSAVNGSLVIGANVGITDVTTQPLSVVGCIPVACPDPPLGCIPNFCPASFAPVQVIVNGNTGACDTTPAYAQSQLQTTLNLAATCPTPCNADSDCSDEQKCQNDICIAK